MDRKETERRAEIIKDAIYEFIHNHQKGLPKNELEEVKQREEFLCSYPYFLVSPNHYKILHDDFMYNYLNAYAKSVSVYGVKIIYGNVPPGEIWDSNKTKIANYKFD